MTSFPIFRTVIWDQMFPKPSYVLMVIFSSIIFGVASLISPWASLLAALGFNALLLAFVRPIVLCYWVIAGISLTSGMVRGQIIPVLIPNEAILVFSVALALPFVLAKRSHLIRLPIGLIISSFILIGGTMILPLIAYFFRGISLSLSQVIKIIAPIQYIPLALLFVYVPENDEQRYNLVRWMWLCSGIVAAVGLAQAANIQPVVAFLQKWYPSSQSKSVSLGVERVTSLMGVWNGLGTFLMTNMLILRAFQHVLKSRIDRLTAAISFFLCITCLLASGSYAGLIGFVLGFAIISFFDGRGLKEIKVILIGLVAGALPLRTLILYRYRYQFGNGGAIPHTFTFRIYVWKDIFWPVIQKNWLWGYRPTFNDLAWKYAESTYVFLLLATGIFGLLAHFVWLFINLDWLWKRMFSRDEIVKTMAVFLFALLIVLSIMGITNEVFTFSGTMDYLWVSLGLLIGKEGLIHVRKQDNCSCVG